MSDNNTTNSESDGVQNLDTSSPGVGTASVESGEAKSSEIAEIKAAFDAERRELQSKLNEAIKSRDAVKDKLTENERAKAKENNDVESLLRSFEEERDAWRGERQALQSKIQRTTVKDTLRRETKGLVREDAFDTFFDLHATSFKSDDSDQVRAVDKDGNLLSTPLKDVVIGFLEEKPFFKADKPAAGTGGSKPADTKSGGASIAAQIAQVSKMSHADKIKALAAGGPELRREWANRTTR